MAQHSLRDALILVGGSTGIQVDVGDGNFTYTEGRPLIYTTDGNALADVREDDEAPLELSLDFTWKRATATPITLIERIKGTPLLTSSDTANPCSPYAVDIYVKFQVTCAAVPTYSQITFPNFRFETLDYDLSAGTISMTGKCNILRANPAAMVP